MADSEAAITRVMSLIGTGESERAIAFADACDGPKSVLTQLRAQAYAHAGSILQDREMLLTAAELWRSVDFEDLPEARLLAANTEQDLWEVAMANDGFVVAIQERREHLQKARELFVSTGKDESIGNRIRAQAFTNLGNTYDNLGRDADALRAYDAALELDPELGMAHGNKAMALTELSRFVGPHQGLVLSQAVEAFDAAFEDEERVREIGGDRALAIFKTCRDRINVTPSPDRDGNVSHHGDSPRSWQDPYFAWCAEYGLFLHVSLDCVSEAESDLDPIYFAGVTVGLSDEEQAHAENLIDAFNAVKQDFIAARYLLWLADGRENLIREHASTVSKRTNFVDSLTYARWGVRTGLAVQAFAAATNLLDKVACLVHLYFRTRRRSSAVSFRNLWHPRAEKKWSGTMDSQLAAQFEDGMTNRGLMALCDLSGDMEIDSPLNKLVQRRHSATHRFVTVHSIVSPPGAPKDTWIDRVAWDDLISGGVQLLGTARTSIIYLARTIDVAESAAAAVRQSELDAAGSKLSIVPRLPSYRAETEDAEFD